MAAAEDDRSDLEAAVGRSRPPADHPDQESSRSHPLLPTNIERVADKVKGLLRSDG